MTEKTSLTTGDPIDVVIAWVDGNDPLLTEKRNKYLNLENKSSRHTGSHSTFFASSNEIRYCVLSIMKYAPFIRNIFIVTDGQDPDLYDDIKTHFPEKLNSVRVVDHTEIFEGFEKYLPTFNSISIANMIWRIKGLSDNFVYFNDDVFLIRMVTEETWFVNNRPVLRGNWRLPPVWKNMIDRIKKTISKYLSGKPEYHPKLSFYQRQWKTAQMLGMRYRYFFHCHTPHPLNRKRIEKFFSENEALLEKNISYRFRNADQFLMGALAYHLEILSGNKLFSKRNLAYLHPYYSDKRLNKKIRKCENDQRIKFGCVQSLEMVGAEQQKKIFRWMDRVLDLNSHR